MEPSLNQCRNNAATDLCFRVEPDQKSNEWYMLNRNHKRILKLSLHVFASIN